MGNACSVCIPIFFCYCILDPSRAQEYIIHRRSPKPSTNSRRRRRFWSDPNAVDYMIRPVQSRIDQQNSFRNHRIIALPFPKQTVQIFPRDGIDSSEEPSAPPPLPSLGFWLVAAICLAACGEGAAEELLGNGESPPYSLPFSSLISKPKISISTVFNLKWFLSVFFD